MAIFVEHDRFRRAILAALADSEMTKILECATFSCKPVNFVIRQTGVPHSTAYRKIKWMLEEGLLFTERIDITPDGKKFSLIRSTIKSLNINYDHGKTTVHVEYNIDRLEKTAERFFSLEQD
jgi:DNA-binding transcriptional ArsR family regulator